MQDKKKRVDNFRSEAEQAFEDFLALWKQVDTNRLRADLSLVLLLCGIGPFPAVIKCSLEAALRCLVLWYGAQPAGDRHIVHFSEPQGSVCSQALVFKVCNLFEYLALIQKSTSFACLRENTTADGLVLDIRKSAATTFQHAACTHPPADAFARMHTVSLDKRMSQCARKRYKVLSNSA
jgi:hypothetical protein